MRRQSIYLDYAATTPVDPVVAERMSMFLTPGGEFGNPASLQHDYGRAAHEGQTGRCLLAGGRRQAKPGAVGAHRDHVAVAHFQAGGIFPSRRFWSNGLWEVI